MGLKTWLVGLGLFGATSGAVAQSSEQKTEDKTDNGVEAVTSGSSERLQVTPAIRNKQFQYRFEQDEDGTPTVKVDIPLAKKRGYNRTVMKKMGISEDSLFNKRHDFDDDDEFQTTNSKPKRSATTARKGDAHRNEQPTDTLSSILKMREDFMNDSDR